MATIGGVNIPCFWRPAKGVWYFGYWCSGVESLRGDGLLCYHDLEGETELIRELDLVEPSTNPLGAFIRFLRLFSKGIKIGGE